ncbi:MAG TPA: hypothetical protein VF848_10890 [Steroidobacteraceae bacterium]
MNQKLSIDRFAAGGLLVALASIGFAGESAAVPVTLSPRLQSTLQDIYGAEEGPKLRNYVGDAIGKALNRANGGCKLNLEVVIDDAMPSHPTPKQQSAAVDPVRSRSLGGAALTGRIFSSSGQELATVNYKNYPPDFTWMSRAFDPWADAHVAMDVFSDQLVSACRKHTPARSAAP